MEIRNAQSAIEAMVKVAAVQFDPKIGKNRRNLKRILELLKQAAESGAKLAVFPEAAISGYVFDSLEEAISVAEDIPGPTTDALEEQCARLNISAVVGLLERSGRRVYNAAVLCGPNGCIGRYRKAHLPYLGVDRFATRGNTPLSVFETPVGRVGVMICYDQRFPEVSRCLTLQGADIIALPTNWPRGAENAPEFILRTRAVENRVFLIGANRVGIERGTEFIGRSCILDPSGNRLADADGASESVLRCEIDPEQARQKRVIIEKGKFEMDTVRDRRPELYGALVEPRKSRVESRKSKVQSRRSKVEGRKSKVAS
ncbi:MAG TPA: carbon-nitrogen hydrolase family protein [Acidobacteriota bacterium]|nr:carbon-nitrogen hydrolase family protein [Acidobacteriota bacterium]